MKQNREIVQEEVDVREVGNHPQQGELLDAVVVADGAPAVSILSMIFSTFASLLLRAFSTLASPMVSISRSEPISAGLALLHRVGVRRRARLVELLILIRLEELFVAHALGLAILKVDRACGG